MKTVNPNLDFLRKIYIFENLNEKSLETIYSLCTEKYFEKDSVIFYENTPGDNFFIILEGEVEICKRYGQRDEMLLAVHGQGDPIGEMALIDNRPRSATVKARTPLRLLSISAEAFMNVLASEQGICLSLLRSVTNMVRRSNQAHIDDLDRQNRELALANAHLKTVQDELLSRERLSVIGRFSSLILHDIRNPLSALKSRVELLKMNRTDPEYFDEAIKKISADISRMEMIAAEFLDYARGEIRLQLTVCSLSTLFDRFAETMNMKLENSRVQLKIENSVRTPVIIDPDRILRVLINAAENACKAMSRGGELLIKSRCDADFLVIEMVDTGEGMSPETLSHIFEPFYSKSSNGGTGLGMIIIKNIVDAHKGTISVHSSEGEGTRLVISLPALP